MLRAHPPTRRPILVLLIATLLAAPALAADGWRTFRGPRGTGEALESLPPGDGPLALALAWKRPLGSGYSGISVADGLLVTAFTDGETDYAIALDAASGEERWRTALGPNYEGQDGSHDGPIATPAIDGGRVFMLDPSGELVALALATGEPVWTRHLVDELGSERPYYGFGGSPLVVGQTVVLQVGGEAGSVAGFHAATGELAWRALPDAVNAQSPIPAEVDGKLQLLVMGDEKVAGLDPADGTVLWEMPHEGRGSMGAATQSPVPLGGNRFLVKHATPATMVLELAAEDGALSARPVAGSRGLTHSYSPATVAGGAVYGFTGRLLSAVDPATGELLWRTREVGDGFAISIGGQLAILEKTGDLFLGPASPEGWTTSARLELFDDLAWTPPSYAGGALYARSLGEIARVDVVRTERQRMATAEAPEIPAVLAELAVAVAASEDPAAEVDRFLDLRALPIVDGRTVVFLWRGEGEDVAVAGDMIGMRREEPMHRLEGTDLWWWATELDPRGRFSYLFYVDLEPRLDPTNDRVALTTILGPDMNWQREEPARMSWFAMPEWPGRPASAAGGGRVEEIEIAVQLAAQEGEEARDPVPVPVAVWLPPGYDEAEASYPVIYVLDPDARIRGRWLETLAAVVGRSVEPVIVAFPDYPPVRGLRGSLGEQVVPAIDARYRTRTDRDSRALVGMGFAGFQAAVLAFRHHELFGALGLQSLFVTTGGMQDNLREVIGEQTAATTPLRIYYEWGRWDLHSPHEAMDFRANARWAWELLREKGYAPAGGEVWDSTDHASWANRTNLLLEALFPLGDGAGEGLSGWLTGE